MYNVENGVDSVIPVDVFVPGCAARPEAIIDGLIKALEILEKKGKEVNLPRLCNSLEVEEPVNRRALLSKCLGGKR